MTLLTMFSPANESLRLEAYNRGSVHYDYSHFTDVTSPLLASYVAVFCATFCQLLWKKVFSRTSEWKALMQDWFQQWRFLLQGRDMIEHKYGKVRHLR